ncbi:uncharacterized protein CTRU02_210210 [Colletotrichum truncatum]|uniref:Uncharacterized protein n=1 Tax=Colletotrichum truncatum TaxID=5467 RepID=A0ACC3YUR6_COLTU|nr:uncharacterized protein CTRU02_11420 [Colletotrichum truncatum]KAF6785795.1 hypothetical protein CTRU02_11420 [Colletotrichum truncatum]
MGQWQFHEDLDQLYPAPRLGGAIVERDHDACTMVRSELLNRFQLIGVVHQITGADFYILVGGLQREDPRYWKAKSEITTVRVTLEIAAQVDRGHAVLTKPAVSSWLS